MYLWKCWLSSRGRFALYAAAGVALGLLIAVDTLGDYPWTARWIIFRNRPDALMRVHQWLWFIAARRVHSFMNATAVWAALAFAGGSLGAEYGAMPFLLTRPRRRSSFVWVPWGLAMAQIAVVLELMLAGVLSVMLARAGSFREWRILWLLPSTVAVAALLYGLAHYLAVLTRSATKGVEFAIAAMLVYMLLPGALEEWWHIHWPMDFQTWSLQVLDWWEMTRAWNAVHFPFAVFACWIAVGLMFMFLSQRLVERREV